MFGMFRYIAFGSFMERIFVENSVFGHKFVNVKLIKLFNDQTKALYLRESCCAKMD